jgi:lipopolysaccharide/colanic/teichoic acid biosynthesis glycosyltransferase
MRWLGLYRARRCARKRDELWRIAVASLIGACGCALVGSQFGPASAVPVAAAAAGALCVAAGRSQFGWWLRARRAEGHHLRRVVVVGAGEDTAELCTMLRSEPELGYLVVGVVGTGASADGGGRSAGNGTASGNGAKGNGTAGNGVKGNGAKGNGNGHAGRGPARHAPGVPSAASVTDIPRLAAATGANWVVVVPYALSRALAERVVAVATGAGLHVQVWSGLGSVGSRRLRSVPVSGEAFFYVEPRRSTAGQVRAKRGIDVAGGGLGLIVGAPRRALAAALVKLEDGGPVLHRGVRIGAGGRPFVAYKFRSMRVGVADGTPALEAINERTDGPLFKASNDPRVTRAGHLLRASSIDELPQLWNVLTGTMSLVGPRPALPDEVDQFDEDLRRRHTVRPGLTGLWQVQARHNPSFNAYRRLDLRYVDTWSLSLDFAIMAATVPAVVSGALRGLRAHRKQVAVAAVGPRVRHVADHV